MPPEGNIIEAMPKHDPSWGDIMLRRFRETGYFSDLDLHFARFMAQLDDRREQDVFLAAALVSRYNRAGHVCADLSVLAGQRIPDGGAKASMACPSLKRWMELLNESPVVGKPGEFRPLIADHNNRMYLRRYWEYQDVLARTLIRRAGEVQVVDEVRLREALDRLFPEQRDPAETDWQKVAATVAASKRFCVISGGPGTGKTTTIARIMALLIQLDPALAGRIALATPTGKAADRMRAAIRQVKESMDCPEEVRRHIPENATTIHRLLGSIADSPYFRHHAARRLPVSLVIIDEASMVDLALLAKLIQALPDQARLILIGDRNQLSSVEAGAVFGDICGAEEQNFFSKDFARYLHQITGCPLSSTAVEPDNNPVRDCIVRLQCNYRFPSDGSFAEVTRAVKQGDGQGALEILSGAGGAIALSRHALPFPEELEHALKPFILAEFSPALTAPDPEEALARLNRFRLLCALREGPYGVFAMNRITEKILHEAGLISSRAEWYAGRIIMITTNDYSLRLFNGDIGIVLPDPVEKESLRVYFQGPEGSLRKFHPARLSVYETAFAITVHKSQGSEYDKVALILPAHDSPVLSREMVYTGLTRARIHAGLWADEMVFKTAVSRRMERFSGLGEIFWPGR